MTFNEFKVLAKAMKAVYTSEKFLPDSDAVKVWYALLKDLDYQTTHLAIQKYMQTNKFPPTIADIRKMSNTVIGNEVNDWGCGWEQVIKAIKRFGCYREAEAMDFLDEITAKVVKRLNWKELCMSENLSVDRANFRMIYEKLATEENERLQLSGELNRAIESNSRKKELLE